MHMFRKDKGLPLAGSQHGPDGSGRAIHMDPPLWRAWKNADVYIKCSYIFLVVSFALMFSGYRSIRHHNASIWLTCHAEECTLEITPPGRGGGVEVEFARRQLIQAHAIKVDANGKFVKLDDSSPFFPSYRNKKSKGNKKTYQKDPNSGPDKEGNYDSYHLVLQPGKSDNVNKEKEGKEDSEDDDKVEENDFEAIKDYTTVDNEGRLLISMRRFNLGQTRRRTRTMVNKVDTYVKQRRDKLVLKENASLSVWGILQLIFGIFMLLLTILLGQFMEESKPRRHGGPGARRQQSASKTTPAKSNLKYRASAAGVRQQTIMRKHY